MSNIQDEIKFKVGDIVDCEDIIHVVNEGLVTSILIGFGTYFYVVSKNGYRHTFVESEMKLAKPKSKNYRRYLNGISHRSKSGL